MIAFALFELNALGVGVFRLHALFFALDEIVDGLGRFFLLGRRFGRQFFAERAVADACKFAPAHDDDADKKRAEGVQRPQPLNGKDQHIPMISWMRCHIVGDRGIISHILGKTCHAARKGAEYVVTGA